MSTCEDHKADNRIQSLHYSDLDQLPTRVAFPRNDEKEALSRHRYFHYLRTIFPLGTFRPVYVSRLKAWLPHLSDLNGQYQLISVERPHLLVSFLKAAVRVQGQFHRRLNVSY